MEVVRFGAKRVEVRTLPDTEFPVDDNVLAARALRERSLGRYTDNEGPVTDEQFDASHPHIDLGST